MTPQMLYELNFWPSQGINLSFSIALHGCWTPWAFPVKNHKLYQAWVPGAVCTPCSCAVTDSPRGFQAGSAKWALLGMAFQSSLLACKKKNNFSSSLIYGSDFAASCPSLNWRNGCWLPFCDPERKLALASGMVMARKDFVASAPEAAVTFTMTGVDDQYVFNPSDPHVFLLRSLEQYTKPIPPPKHWILCET